MKNWTSDQFQFISDLTIRSKAVLGESNIQAAVSCPALVMEQFQQQRGGNR